MDKDDEKRQVAARRQLDSGGSAQRLRAGAGPISRTSTRWRRSLMSSLELRHTLQRWPLLFTAMIAFSAQASVAATTVQPATALAARSPADQANHVRIDAKSLAAASPQGANGCAFQAPAPILRPNVYANQAMTRGSQNELTEKAQLPNGLGIEIRQSACVDIVTTEFVLIVPHDQRLQLDEDGWIELARTEIGKLATHGPPAEHADLIDFLKRAHSLRPRDGIRSACRDGSAAPPGECSWESLGGYVFSVTSTGQRTRVSVTKYVSG